MADYLSKRNGLWQYARRVPGEYDAFALRGMVKFLTKVPVADDSKAIRARKDAARLNEKTEEYGKSLWGVQSAEARGILLRMIGTGMRLSEVTNLTADTIILKRKNPHVRIRRNGRERKTPQSERDIPLVGVPLTAARRFPKGFPRYRDEAAGLSVTVNKVLDSAGLRPNGQSLYSIRHSFSASPAYCGHARNGHRLQPAQGRVTT